MPSRSSAEASSRPRHREKAGALLRLAALAAVAATGTWLLHGPTIEYGFDYDDYYFVKPYTRSEVLATFTGSWDHSGIMVPFYRPLTVTFYALRFELFGLNAEAHHAMSLALFALAALLAAVWVLRVSGSLAVAATTAVAFVTHPAMPYAQVAWVTNQMHLLASVIVLGGLLWAHVAARRGLAWWLPLLPIAVAAFLVKEDGVILLPAVIALHWLRRRVLDASVPPMPKVFVALAALLVLGLVAMRNEALGGLGGYGRPSSAQAWMNFKIGLQRVFRFIPGRRPWQEHASWFATLLPYCALLAWRWSNRGPRYIAVAGLVIGLLFNLPFVFVTKREQMHLVALGAALLFSGSAAAVVGAMPRRALRAGFAVVMACGFLTFASVSRNTNADFAPFGAMVRSHDEIVQGWAAVPTELRDYLRRKGEPGAAGHLSANPVDELQVVAFGLHEYETAPDGTRFRWMAQNRVELHVSSAVVSLTIPLRHEHGAFRVPAHVTVRANGRLVDSFVLDDSDYRWSRIALRPADVRGWSRMHRVVIEIPEAWVPSQVLPGSSDGRLLGLQVGEMTVVRH